MEVDVLPSDGCREEMEDMLADLEAPDREVVVPEDLRAFLAKVLRVRLAELDNEDQQL